MLRFRPKPGSDLKTPPKMSQIFPAMKSNKIYHAPLQYSCRPLVLIALAACSWGDVTFAQDPAAPASPAPGSSPAPTDTPAPAVPGAAKDTAPAPDTAPPTTPSAKEKPSSPFRTGESSRAADAAKKSPFAFNTGDTDAPQKVRKLTDRDADAEASAAPRTGGDGSDNRIVAPGFYGHGPQVITPGQGQYARPKYRYGFSVGVGYDDNPDQITNANLGPLAKPRKGTGFTYLNGHWDAQWLKPRTVFTVNLEVGGDFYFDRPGNSSDANARLALLYVNKIDPRSQFTANASFAYLSQPDYSNLYASSSIVGGDYFTGSTKFDYTYRWTRVFQTVTSASVNLLKYVNDSPTKLSNSYWSFMFGNEFRFIASPRITWVAEGRYELDRYMSNSSLDSESAYILGGMDWIVSRRMNATFRTGASIRSFDSGGSNTAPYTEVSLNYMTGRHSTLSINGRYGFEQSSAVGDKNLSYRLGLLYQQAFTTRISGNVGFNFIHTGYEPRTGTKSSTDVYNVNLGAQYRIDRHFSLGLRYTYTLQSSSTGLQDFDRNRILFTGQYEY